MLFKRILSTILLSLLLTSCGQLTTIFQGSETRLEQLLTEDEYHRALQLLEKIKTDHPLYEKRDDLKNEIAQKSIQYESNRVATIKDLEKKLQWQDALAAANQANKKLPTSKPIIETRETLLKNRDQYINNQQLKLAIEQAKHLPIQADILTAIKQTTVKDRNRDNYLEQTQEQLQSAHSKLTQAATTAIDQQQWEAAHQYLLLAKNIRSDKAMEQLISTTQEKITLKKQKKNESVQNQQQQNLDEKLNSLNKAINQNQLVQALVLSSELEPWKKQPEVTALLEKLTTIVAERVKQLSIDGQELYSQGHLDNAIRQWQQAIALDPNNSEIEDKLHRAEAFKANYEKLRQPDQ